MQSQSNQNVVEYTSTTSKMTDEMGMHYSFSTQPITYRCNVVESNDPSLETQDLNVKDKQPYAIHIRDSNANLSENVEAYLNERAQHPRLWTLRSFMPTPPPLPERLPVHTYRINLNYTHTDARIRSGEFKLFTRQWPGFQQEAGRSEFAALSHAADSSTRKPKPSHFSQRRTQRIQKARHESHLHPQPEQHPKENSTIEDLAEVFPAGVKALGAIEKELGKLAHIKSWESHGEQLQQVAEHAAQEKAAPQPIAHQTGAAMR